MGARIYDPEEEKRLGLKPLPDVPFCDAEQAATLNVRYSAARARHRMDHPIIESLDHDDPRVLTPEEIRAKRP
jgi:hypothetical protein